MKAPTGPSPGEQTDIAREAPGALVQIAGDRAARLPLRARAMRRRRSAAFDTLIATASNEGNGFVRKS